MRRNGIPALAANYTIPVGDGDNRFLIGANVKYLDDYATEVEQGCRGACTPWLPPRNHPGAHLGRCLAQLFRQISMAASEYKLSAFVNDAFHEGGRIVRSSQAGPFWFSDRIPNRTWGVELHSISDRRSAQQSRKCPFRLERAFSYGIDRKDIIDDRLSLLASQRPARRAMIMPRRSRWKPRQCLQSAKARCWCRPIICRWTLACACG